MQYFLLDIVIHPFALIILILSLSQLVCGKDDLYKILGVNSKSTLAEIKRAYRNKARDTHPDKVKQSGLDPETITSNFRKLETIIFELSLRLKN